MDKTDLISRNINSVSNLAVDGLLYGLVSGTAMFLSLAAFALLSGNTPRLLLEHFGISGLASPMQGLLSHLAVSAIYGILFGVLIWPMLRKFSSARFVGLVAGLLYGVLLLILAQIAILPGTSSPLGQIPLWQWVLGHLIYGLVLGSLFGKKI